MDEDDFNLEDLSAEEMDGIDKERREKNKEVRTSAIFKKANEIREIVTAILESLSEEDKQVYETTLTESAMLLAPKLAGAMASNSWLISMQNASIIRYHAEYLLSSSTGLKMFTNVNKDYVKLLRTAMEEFRELFNDWVQTFDKLEKEPYTDEWGLFLRNS